MSIEARANIDYKEAAYKVLKALGKQKAIIAILLMLAAMVFSDSNFYTTRNIVNVFAGASVNVIIAFGVTFAVICRGCDLSVGAVASLSGIITLLLMETGMNMWLAITLAVLSGALIGFVNGFLIVHQKTEAFIITLGMGILAKGIGQLLTNANPVRGNMQLTAIATNALFKIPVTDAHGRVTEVTVPYIILFMIIIGLFTFFLLRFTSFGRNCYALGGDYEVAEHSGINVIRTKWIAFTLTGTYAAIAGVLMSSRLNGGSIIYGDEIPLMVNCGVVIGGTSFAGGIGGAGHSFLGIMVMQLLRNCLNAIGIDQYVQMMILGIMIVTIICMDCYAIKRKKEDV
jgi:ribose transport system permease protein